MLAATGRDITARVASLEQIRFWSFVFLAGTFAVVAGLAIALVLWLTRRIAEEQANEFSRFAIEHMPQGICVFDKNDRLVMCNHRYYEIYDLDPEKAKPGVTLQEILGQRIDQGHIAADSAEAYVRERLEAARSPEVWTRLQHLPNGRCLSVFHRPMKGGGWISTQEDISDRVQIEVRIAHMAHHDALTDLPNRILLRERMALAFESRRSSDGQWAFLLLDLDRFKEVNDALGHPIGDSLLKAVASRLRLSVREGDTVARLGGDEFAILQASPSGELDCDALARRIIEILAEPFEINGHSLSVGASIGIAFAPKDAAEPDELIRNADLALYRAKSTGRGRHHFFEPDLDLQMQARRALEQGLRVALTDNEFELFYQPIVNLATDRICSFEALLRWNKPREGRIAPSAFIEVAEESGLMVDIGRWVMRQACLEAAAWPGELQVAVNVSPSQFKSRQFLPMVKEALAESGLPAARLELEITETVVLESGSGAFEILRQVHDLGVRLALDDFGTGYSSLTNLRQFPFNKIKIDRSFVSDISKGTASSCAIVRSVAGLGISLGMTTTAEGVETQDQLDQVRTMGCTEMQGYFFSPPRPAKEVLALLQRHSGLLEFA